MQCISCGENYEGEEQKMANEVTSCGFCGEELKDEPGSVCGVIEGTFKGKPLDLCITLALDGTEAAACRSCTKEAVRQLLLLGEPA